MHATPSILIASASAGSGHVRAADALLAAFGEREPAVHAEHVDVLDLAPGWVRRAYAGGFELMAARAPTLWAALYRTTDRPGADAARWGRLAERILFREFQRLLLSRPWATVLCTHFLPCQLAASRSAVPFALTVTDFTLHRYWVQPGVRRYFVATEDLAAELRARTRRVRVTATGIPVHPQLLGARPRLEARGALDLPLDRQVVLVVGGGCGIGVEEAATAAADATDAVVVAVCGRNGAAERALRRLGVPPDRLRVHGWAEGLHDWMAAADLVVTKPGGLTTSEALALGRPLLLTRGMPGHEAGNARALQRMGAALVAPDAPALRHALATLLPDPARLASMQERARRSGALHAAQSVAAALQREHLLEAA